MEDTNTGFQLPLSDCRYVDRTDSGAVQPVDLMAMARRALNYLKNNPLPDHDYQCRFSFGPLSCPPLQPDTSWWNEHMETHLVDPIMVGDTESRNDTAFNMVRLMLGDRETGYAEQEAVHDRLAGYMRGDGGFGRDLCWTRFYSMCVCDGKDWANYWTTGHLLQSECDRYRLDPAGRNLDRARRLFEGIRDSLIRRDGMAYHPTGMAGFNAQGEHTLAYADHFPMLMGPLCEYWAVSGDDGCRQLLCEFAEGVIRRAMPTIPYREDGGVDGHNHVMLHGIRGMAQFACMTGEPRYLEWIRRVYDYYRKWALDTGWLPEMRQLEDHSNHSETCLNGDMHEIECWLALAGYDELWDRVDRGMRNYFAPAQFALTPELEAMYRRVNADKAPAMVEAGLKTLRELDGGFISALTPNDRVFSLREEADHLGAVRYEGRRICFDMMGCCPPEGIRALYYTWKNVVTEEDRGVFVRLPYSINEPAAEVVARPERGTLTVRAKKSGRFYIRVPQWAPRERVTATRGGEALDVVWSGPANRYVLFRHVQPGDVLTVTHPLLDMHQEVCVKPVNQPEQRYTYHWIGNTVAGVTPQGTYLPLYDWDTP